MMLKGETSMGKICREFIFCLQETAFRVVLKQPLAPKHPEECFLNPPCGCSNPGKELTCEECPHLEACLSQFKTRRGSGSNIKRRVLTNTRN
jgi:hypothetical protein